MCVVYIAGVFTCVLGRYRSIRERLHSLHLNQLSICFICWPLRMHIVYYMVILLLVYCCSPFRYLVMCFPWFVVHWQSVCCYQRHTSPQPKTNSLLEHNIFYGISSWCKPLWILQCFYSAWEGGAKRCDVFCYFAFAGFKPIEIRVCLLLLLLPQHYFV